MRSRGSPGSGALAGLLMLVGGLYLLARNIVVGGGALFGYAFASPWGVHLTSGYALIPLMFGVGLLFYGKTRLGWTVVLCSGAGILFGVIAELRLSLRYMDLFDLGVILALIAGGSGLLLRAYHASWQTQRVDAEIDRRVAAELAVRLERRAGDPFDRLRRLRERQTRE